MRSWLAGNKCQTLYRVMLRVWGGIFSCLVWKFHRKSYVNTLFLYQDNLASHINSVISRRFNRKIKKYRFWVNFGYFIELICERVWSRGQYRIFQKVGKNFILSTLNITLNSKLCCQSVPIMVITCIFFLWSLPPVGGWVSSADWPHVWPWCSPHHGDDRAEDAAVRDLLPDGVRVPQALHPGLRAVRADALFEEGKYGNGFRDKKKCIFVFCQKNQIEREKWACRGCVHGQPSDPSLPYKARKM